uniref:Uncharacterized protein n=1 Tax=Rhodococcus hoagii TaxID=43767 RepID=A0A1Z1UX18_RHOHA|nr:hypothetical protein pVAPN1572_0001 [Prescottella equi]
MVFPPPPGLGWLAIDEHLPSESRDGTALIGLRVNPRSPIRRLSRGGQLLPGCALLKRGLQFDGGSHATQAPRSPTPDAVARVPPAPRPHQHVLDAFRPARAQRTCRPTFRQMQFGDWAPNLRSVTLAGLPFQSLYDSMTV